MRVARKTIMNMLADPVMDFPALPRRIDMHVHASKVLNIVEELVSHLTGDPVSITDR